MRKHLNRRSVLLGLAGTACLPRYASGQDTGAGSIASLTRTYQRQPLLAVSPNGKLLCLVRTDQPTDSFIVRLGGVFRTSAPTNDEIVIVDGLSGRELFSQKGQGRISWASFFPDGNRLYARVRKPRSGGPSQIFHLLIDLRSGEVVEYENAELPYLATATDQTLVGMIRDTEDPARQTLIKVELPEYVIARQIELRDARLTGLTFSQNRQFFFSILGRHQMVVRRSVDLGVAWEDELSSMVFPLGATTGSTSLSANGSYCAVSASAEANSNDSSRGVATRVYRIETGELVAELPIICFGRTAVSPDGTLLARGLPISNPEERVVVVELYDTASTQRIAVLEQDRYRLTGRSGELLRSGFVENGIQFTADGRYLITSSYHTRVWRISRP